MKKFLLCLIVACVCVFGGCSKSPTFTVVVNSDSTVMQQVFIPFDDAEFAKFNVDLQKVEQMKLIIANTFTNKFVEMYNAFDQKITNDTSLTEIEKLQIRKQCVNIGDIKCYKVDGGLGFEFNFENALVYNYYHSDKNYGDLIKDLLAQEQETSKSFFITNNISKNTSIYASKMTDGSGNETGQLLGDFIISQTRKVLGENTDMTDLEIESVLPTTFTYVYGTTSGRQHSNADKIVKNGDLYLHHFEINSNNLEKEIVLYTTVANQYAWYITIFGAGVVFACVLYIVCFFKGKKPKPQQDDKN